MADWMTKNCREGCALLWEQCDSSRFQKGLDTLAEAGRSGDSEAWYFLGLCYGQGFGGAGIDHEKAHDCFYRAAYGGSRMALLGALRAGQMDALIRRSSRYSPEECFSWAKEQADGGDPYAAFQVAQTIEWEDLRKAEAAEVMAEAAKPAGGKAPEAGKAEEKEPESAPSGEKPGEAEESAADKSSEETKEPEHAEKPAVRIPCPAPFECVPYYQKAADGGIVAAMEKLGRLYKDGRFVRKDDEQYYAFAQRCAGLGNAWGLCELGILAEASGDRASAYEYYRAADIQGEIRAAYPLGEMYLEGEVTDRDVSRAVECLKRAADSGDRRSFAALGNLYYRDEYVERDDEKAFYWYNLAYSTGSRAAALPLAHLYLRESQSRDIPKAVKLLKEAAAPADPEGRRKLAAAGIQPTGEDVHTAGEACLTLGNICRDGITGVTEPLEAARWYENGANTGNAECMELLGLLYYQGEDGMPADYDRAFAWLSKCYEKGTLQAVSKLAMLYLNGQGCEADERRAEALFKEASRTEFDGVAFCELARIYEKRGGSENLEKAVDCYHRASEMGNEEATKRLSHFKKNLFGRWKVSE